ncbi:carboxylesterase/lipase family protein [Kribbella koreensis]|uniref:carboxylesterase/lipase family protein n=1 Tax=Kribbella koreensis TaxID=57909 RepID=UPI0031D9811E
MTVRGIRWAAALAAGSAVTLGISALPAASADVVVRTGKGLVRGTADASTRVFQGIPYAARPERWTLPRPAAAWTGVRDASRPGPMCSQLDAEGKVDPRSSEDCLFLNVTTPAGRGAGRRPVIVWFHGGGWASGNGADYEARSLSRIGDAVVVTVNSRLGIFGFFGYPGLTDGGTFGLADQQASLRWVRANARAFGGDPANVTIMGESSGGASVCAQLVSPRSAGLFQRAVIESGSCLQHWAPNVMVPDNDAIEYWAPRSELARNGRTTGTELGCADLACLRGTPDVEGLLNHNALFGTPAYGTPILPVDPRRALKAGLVHRVPVLQGNTRDEHRYFARFFEDDAPMTAAEYRANLVKSFGRAMAAQIEKRYPVRAYPSPLIAWATVTTDSSWVCPTAEASRLLARRTPVYSFSFDDPHAAVLEGTFPAGYPAGAYHGSEVAYLFDFGPAAPMTATQRGLSGQMIRYWTNFARSGDPNGPGLPRWPAFAGGPTTQSLAPGRIGQVDLAVAHKCSAWK